VRGRGNPREGSPGNDTGERWDTSRGGGGVTSREGGGADGVTGNVVTGNDITGNVVTGNDITGNVVTGNDVTGLRTYMRT